MTDNFRIEPFVGQTGSKIKVYAKINEDLPVKIDVETRYCVLFESDRENLENYRNFEVRKDDVWVITSPKCGTTWTLELCWLLMNNLDFETAMTVDQTDRSPYLDFAVFCPTKDSIEAARNFPSPRLMKSHLPMHLLPKGLWTVKPKIIYVVRDVKDVIVSSYYFYSGLGLNSRILEFLNEFLNHKVLFTSFWQHAGEFWKLRNEPNILFTSYERMIRDHRSVVLQVSEFLQKPIDENGLDDLLDYLSFEKMKKNKSCHLTKLLHAVQRYMHLEEDSSRIPLVRKGVVGSHKEEFGKDVIRQIEEWTQKSLEPYGVTSEEMLLS